MSQSPHGVVPISLSKAVGFSFSKLDRLDNPQARRQMRCQRVNRMLMRQQDDGPLLEVRIDEQLIKVFAADLPHVGSPRAEGNGIARSGMRDDQRIVVVDVTLHTFGLGHRTPFAGIPLDPPNMNTCQEQAPSQQTRLAEPERWANVIVRDARPTPCTTADTQARMYVGNLLPEMLKKSTHQQPVRIQNPFAEERSPVVVVGSVFAKRRRYEPTISQAGSSPPTRTGA